MKKEGNKARGRLDREEWRALVLRVREVFKALWRATWDESVSLDEAREVVKALQALAVEAREAMKD